MSTQDSEEILREVRPEDSNIPPLDPALFKVSDEEKEFLHSAISEDDDATYKKALEIQSK